MCVVYNGVMKGSTGGGSNNIVVFIDESRIWPAPSSRAMTHKPKRCCHDIGYLKFHLSLISGVGGDNVAVSNTFKTLLKLFC